MNECIVILHPTNAAASLQIDFDSIAGSVLAWDEWILWNPSILERKWAVKPINLKKKSNILISFCLSHFSVSSRLEVQVPHLFGAIVYLGKCLYLDFKMYRNLDIQGVP